MAHVGFKDAKGEVVRYKVFFSTDLQVGGQTIFDHYRLRFQQGRLAIESLFRGAKQYVGLTSGQSVDKDKRYMHVNLALTSVSLARAVHWQRTGEGRARPFSMKNIKVCYFNQLLMDRIFMLFGIEPDLTKNQSALERLNSFGARAA